MCVSNIVDHITHSNYNYLPGFFEALNRSKQDKKSYILNKIGKVPMELATRENKNTNHACS